MLQHDAKQVIRKSIATVPQYDSNQQEISSQLHHALLGCICFTVTHPRALRTLRLVTVKHLRVSNIHPSWMCYNYNVKTAALANYMYSVWESSYTFIALAIHTLKYSPGNMHIPSLCFALYYITSEVSSFMVS